MNPGIQGVMSLKRFERISEMLHISDREAEDPEDKLIKIRWLYKHLQAKFMAHNRPSKNQVIDEGMYIIQYMYSAFTKPFRSFETGS